MPQSQQMAYAIGSKAETLIASVKHKVQTRPIQQCYGQPQFPNEQFKWQP